MRNLGFRHEDTHLPVAGALVAGSIVLVVGLMVDRLNFDVIAGAMTALILVLVFVPLLNRIARNEGEPWLRRLLLWALLAKFGFTLVRYFVIMQIYDGNADAGPYTRAGAYLADLYLQGVFTTDVPSLATRGPETTRIAVIVGVVYTITGFSKYAAFFVFSAICFSGQLLMWRAFKLAVPEGDHKRYAILVFFLPSMLFWPSSVGKEAIMIGCIGLASFGAAHILSDRVRLRGLLIFAAGAGALFLFRPHMGMIAIAALGLASVVGALMGFQRRASNRAFAVRVGALVLLVAAAAAATTQLSKFFADDSSDEGGVGAVLERTVEQTETGGSEFAPPTVSNPLELPAGVVTVLFRPFPWESGNLNGLIASAEGLLLLGLFIAGRRRMLTWWRTAAKRPYLVYAFSFAMVFIITFSYIGNFGILARQRTQMLPLVLTLIAMYPAARTRYSMLWGAADDPQGEADRSGSEPVPLGRSIGE